MPTSTPLQAAYNAGEFAPTMWVRADFDKYASALRRGENLILLPQGGAARRGGSRYVAEVKASANDTFLIPFVFSVTQAYQIEMGANYFRFFTEQAQITTVDITASITGDDSTFTSGIGNWSDISPGTGAISHNATDDRLSLDANTTPGTNFAHAELTVTNSSAIAHILKFQVIGAPGDTIKVRVGTSTGASDIINDQVVGVGYHMTEFTATAANFFVQFIYDENAKSVEIDNVSLLDNEPIELTTPYAQADLSTVRWTQSNDTLYLFHEDYPIYSLLRLGNASWSLEELSLDDGPYLDENVTDTTITAAAASGLGVNFTASAIKGINKTSGGSFQGFVSTDVGRLIRVNNGTTYGFGVIVSITSTLVAVVDIRDNVPTGAQTAWSLGAFSGTTGYPKVGTFHEQRLAVGNTPNDPDKYWMSQSNDFPNFRFDSDVTGGGVEVQDDDGIDYRLASDQVNAINWLRSAKAFAIGTQGGEWAASSSATGDVLTPSDNDTKQQTRIGSKFVDAIQVDNAVLFAQRGGRRIHEYAFSFEDDSFRSPDLTILSEHITRGGVEQMVYAAAPHSTVLVRRGDGKVGALTYKREENVVGWSRWTMGGTDAAVKSLSVIPGANAGGQVQSSIERDEIWAIVERTINSATVKYVEFFEDTFEGPEVNDYDGYDDDDYITALLAVMPDMYYSDSLITYDGVATTTITGLDHLEGESVTILADGAVHGNKTVASGSVELDVSASTVQIGLAYFHDIQPMILTGSDPKGSALFKDKRIRETQMRLHESGSLTIGATRSDLREVPLRQVSDEVNTAVPLFSGTIAEEPSGGDFIPDPTVIIRDSNPTAFTLLGWTHDVYTST